MILTGNKIKQAQEKNDIAIEPFTLSQINPNSYNYRLGHTLLVDKNGTWEENTISEEGFVLQPGQIYLCNTQESIGSKKYAMSLMGRSSMGRLGLFLQVSANLGHTGSSHQWTLELVAVKPLRVYAGMIIGQVSFWTNSGVASNYSGGYSQYSIPKISKLEEKH